MEHDDDALTAAGWTVRRFERRSGAQAGGRYQTWQPPAGEPAPSGELTVYFGARTGYVARRAAALHAVNQ